MTIHLENVKVGDYYSDFIYQVRHSSDGTIVDMDVCIRVDKQASKAILVSVNFGKLECESIQEVMAKLGLWISRMNAAFELLTHEKQKSIPLYSGLYGDFLPTKKEQNQ